MNAVDKLKSTWEKADANEIDAAISALLEHRHGRRFLWWLLSIGKVGGQPYTNNALHTAFSCGELNIGNQVLDRVISTGPEGYIKMMKENADERSTRDDELGRASDIDRSRDTSGRDGSYEEPDRGSED